MTTFYDRAGIRITERWLTVGGRRYPIDQLCNLRRARGCGDRTTRRAVCLAALSLLVVAATGPLLPAAMSMVMVVAFVGLPVVVAAVRTWLVRPAHLLWADYRGRRVQLHETRDETEFGKISRALIRASTCGRHSATGPVDFSAELVIPGSSLGLPPTPGR
jgi:hypothetical protein